MGPAENVAAIARFSGVSGALIVSIDVARPEKRPRRTALELHWGRDVAGGALTERYPCRARLRGFEGDASRDAAEGRRRPGLEARSSEAAQQRCAAAAAATHGEPGLISIATIFEHHERVRLDV